jgi:carbamoyltransferase
MKVLGISAFAHDSAAAIVVGDEIIAAAEEERFNRKKHTGEFPRHAIQYCLDEAGIEANHLDKIAFFLNARPDFPQNYIDVYKVVGLWALKHSHAFKNGFMHAINSPKSLANILDNSSGTMNSIANWGKIVRIELELENNHSPELIGVPHHKCHIGSSFMISGYQDAAILIADQRGELDATTLAFGNNQHVDILKSIALPDSLGSLYGLITSYLGFRALSGEGKVMGLSSYGEPHYIDEFNRYLEQLPDGLYKLNTEYIDFSIGAFAHFFPEKLIKELGYPRDPAGELEENHSDIAKSLQIRLEEALLSLCEYIRTQRDYDRICLSGGIALNSAANGRIACELFNIDEVYVPPAPGDAGTALGSAVWTAAQSINNGDYKLDSPYLGPGFQYTDYKNALDDAGLPYKRFDNVCKIGAKVLNEDMIIAWFQGRMEFGPRALGNRSILANPKRTETRDRLNELKGRELWRPLAPSFLQNRVSEYFTHDCKSPYMSFVVPVRPEMREKIPGCVHVDGTARLQTVEYSSNPKYWGLLKEFEALTGLPCVINTSFNRRGEPIVCSPTNAVQSFMNMNLDFLILGDFIASKDAAALESL